MATLKQYSRDYSPGIKAFLYQTQFSLSLAGRNPPAGQSHSSKGYQILLMALMALMDYSFSWHVSLFSDSLIG